MIKSSNKSVLDFIHELQAHANKQYEIVNAIREIVLAQNAEIGESIKYGGIVYQRADRLVAGIFSYRNHVSLELGKGFELDDVYAVLEGAGKYRRHIKLHHLSEVEAKNAEYYIQASLKQA